MREIYNKVIESFKEDTISKDGIQVIPVTDAKAAIKFAIKQTIEKTVVECMRSARVNHDCPNWNCVGESIDMDSIFSVKEKLINEL